MHQLTLRGALPVIVLLALVTLAIIAFVLLSHHAFGGTAYQYTM